jgi:hypothetical protein
VEGFLNENNQQILVEIGELKHLINLYIKSKEKMLVMVSENIMLDCMKNIGFIPIKFLKTKI